MAKALQYPLDKKLENLNEVPYTISFVIRKRMQIDNFNELSQDKRPPELMIWSGTPEQIDEWLDKVLDSRKRKQDTPVYLDISKIEG
jgi:hypothetical protein